MPEVLQRSDFSEVFNKLTRLQVGGCTCMTKTPDIQYHNERCTYRLASELEVELEKVIQRFAPALSTTSSSNQG